MCVDNAISATPMIHKKEAHEASEKNSPRSNMETPEIANRLKLFFIKIG
jgi:hypothetical protein